MPPHGFILVSLWMMLFLKEDEVAEVVETSHAWECQEEDAGSWSLDRAIFRTWKMLSQAWPVVKWLPRCWTRLSVELLRGPWSATLEG